MKGLIAAILMLATFSASANEGCATVASLGKTIMTGRQMGISIVKAVEISKRSEAAMTMVKMAYAKPRFESEEYKQKAAEDFETEVYLICIGGV